MSEFAMRRIDLSPTAFASTISADFILGDVRVEGWIKAESMESGLEACRLLGGLFDRETVGGFSLDGTFTDFPFSFDVRPDFLVRLLRHETKEELMARVRKVLEGAGRRLKRERNMRLKELEAGMFEYLEGGEAK